VEKKRRRSLTRTGGGGGRRNMDSRQIRREGVDDEDAFSAVIEVTRFVVLVEDTLGASRIDATVLVNDWEELDVTPTGDERKIFVKEGEDGLVY